MIDLLDRLCSEVEVERLCALSMIERFIDSGVMGVDKVREKKGCILDLLKSKDKVVRSEAWDKIRKLVAWGMITWEDAPFFLQFLAHEDEGLRLWAWWRIKGLLNLGIITLDEVKGKKEHFLKLLESQDEYMRVRAWLWAKDLLDRDIVTWKDLVQMKVHLLKLLKSQDERVRADAWEAIKEYIYLEPSGGLASLFGDGGEPVINKEDAPFFLELLESQDERVRADAWNKVGVLMEVGIITLDEVKRRKKYFLKLLTSNDFDIRFHARRIMKELVSKGVIPQDEVEDLVEFGVIGGEFLD